MESDYWTRVFAERAKKKLEEESKSGVWIPIENSLTVTKTYYADYCQLTNRMLFSQKRIRGLLSLSEIRL